jgi:hypothetical protein
VVTDHLLAKFICPSLYQRCCNASHPSVKQRWRTDGAASELFFDRQLRVTVRIAFATVASKSGGPARKTSAHLRLRSAQRASGLTALRGSPPVRRRQQADIVVRGRSPRLGRALAGFSPVDRDLPQPDGIYFEPHWGRRFVGTAGPISAASRDVFQPDIGRSWARITPNLLRPTSTLAEYGCRFNFRIPFQVTPSRPAWEDAGLRR